MWSYSVRVPEEERVEENPASEGKEVDKYHSEGHCAVLVLALGRH